MSISSILSIKSIKSIVLLPENRKGHMGHIRPGKGFSRECGMIYCSSVRAGRLFPEAAQRAAPESCLKTIYKSRYAGVESFAPLAGPATAGEKSCENRMQDCVQNEAKGCPK